MARLNLSTPSLSAKSGGRFRRGNALRNVVVVAVLLSLAIVITVEMLSQRAVSGRYNTCRKNLSDLVKALSMYERRVGHFPGYMNALSTANNELYRDPLTELPTPVSWVVMVLPELDRESLFDMYRMDSRARRDAGYELHQFIEIYTCPNDPPQPKWGTPISYVVNTGLRDAPLSATMPDRRAPDGLPLPGIPRDWPANGVFFDHYTCDPLVESDERRRPPKVTMRRDSLKRPKDKIILLTENVDADSYVLDATRDAADDWRRAESSLGAVWWPDEILNDDGKSLRTHAKVGARNPNGDAGQGDGSNFNYARPSARHPGGFNVAFAGMNVQFMSDRISYYVYAKLMTTADEGVMLPGTRTAVAEAFAKRQVTVEEINP